MKTPLNPAKSPPKQPSNPHPPILRPANPINRYTDQIPRPRISARKPYKNLNKICYYNLQNRCIYGENCYNSHAKNETNPTVLPQAPPQHAQSNQNYIKLQGSTPLNPVYNGPTYKTFVAVQKQSPNLHPNAVYSAKPKENPMQMQPLQPTYSAVMQQNINREPSTYPPLKVTGYSNNFVISPEFVDTTKIPMLCQNYLTNSCNNVNCDYIHELVPKY